MFSRNANKKNNLGKAFIVNTAFGNEIQYF